MEDRIYDRSQALSALEEMNYSDLKQYIEERLRGRQVPPAPDPRVDESPSYIIENAYEKSRNEGFKEELERAIAELLAAEQLVVSENDYLCYLLLLCEKYQIKKAGIPLAGMIAGERLKGCESFGVDIHSRALMAFSRLPEGRRMKDLWIDAIYDPRYTHASFAALRSQGIEAAIEYLPRYAEMYIKDPEALNLPMAVDTLYLTRPDDLSEGDVTDKILMTIRDVAPEIRKEILDTFLRRKGRAIDTSIAAGSEEDATISVDGVKLYRIVVKLFQAGYHDMLDEFLDLPKDRAPYEYLLGLLFLDSGEQRTAIKLFTSAFNHGLTIRESREIGGILELKGPKDLKHRLFPAILALPDDDREESLAAAAELIRVLEVARNDSARAAKWEWSNLESENPDYFTHRIRRP